MAVRSLFWLAALAALAFSSRTVEPRNDPFAADLLKLGGDYVAQYAERLGAVSAEEDANYRQVPVDLAKLR